MGVKMYLGMITEKYVANSEIEYPTKAILQPFALTRLVRQRMC